MICLMSGLWAYCQKVWTLKECIDYAKENNLSVKLSKLQDTLAADDIYTAKAAWYPSLSLSSGQNFTYANHTDEGVYNGSYALNSNLTIYDGGKTINNIKQKTLAKDIAAINVENEEHDIMLSILQTYIQILYAKEAITTAKSNLELSNRTLERSEEMLKVGSISSVDYAILESENADYAYRVVEAENVYNKQKLELKQLMELKQDIEIEEITIEDEDVMIVLEDVGTIYNKALTFVPNILYSQKNKELAQLNVRNAQSGYYPDISLSAGVNTGHNSKSDLEVMKQLKNSVNENVGLNISIPIYDKRQTKSAVIIAKNQVLVAQNNIAMAEKNLYKTIDELHLDCISYQNSYKSAKANLSSCEKSYNLVEQQFDLGLKNIIELLNQRNSLSTAQQNVLQTKYQALIKIKLLDYYQNKELNL